MSGPSTIPTPATPDVCTIAILVDGHEIPGVYQLLSVSVSRELNRIPKATLQFKDGEAATATFAASNTDLFIPGKEIEIRLGYRSENTSVFKGIVIRHSIKVRKAGSMLIVECRDKAVKMTVGTRSRYFTEKSDGDIMEESISEYGLQHDVVAKTLRLKEVMQFDCTDWDFLLCRAEANGCVVAVEDGKIIVARPSGDEEPVVGVAFGSTLLELDAEIDARWQSRGIKAVSWNPTDQEMIEAEASEPAASTLGNLAPDALADVIGGAGHVIRHGGQLRQPELQAWADARLLKERLAKVRGRAKFQGFAGVLPGKVVEVTGIGERFEGKMYVSAVRQSVANGNWETDVQLGLDPRLIAATFAVSPLPASGLLSAVSGLQIGIVTVLEGDPDGEERIKVRLPVVANDDEGAWARIATLDAGDGRGTFFRPEIGDEVLVGFLGDDPRHPVVLGMCHSSKHPAPEPATDDNHRKGYVSREKLRMTFDDEKKFVQFETPGGNRVSLSEEDKGIVIEDQNGNRITMDDGGIVIESTKDLTLKAANDVKVEGMNVTLKASAGFKATAGASAEMSGASTKVEGSATTVIKGGLVQIN